MNRRNLALAIVLGIAGCAFTSYETVVPYGKLNYAANGALGLSADGTTLWVQDYQATTSSYTHAMKVFDAATGNQLASVSWASSWEAVAFAADHGAGHEDEAWTLHANGYRIRWNPTLTGYSEIEVPIPLTGATAADGRWYCDMDRSEDDIFYLVTMDYLDGDWTTWLYREPVEGTWERVELTDLMGKCGRVSVDDVTGEVAVLDLTHDAILRFDENTLVQNSTLDLSAEPGDAVDLAAMGGYAVVAWQRSGTDPDRLVLHASDGSEEDTQDVGYLAATLLEYDGTDLWAWWTGFASSAKYTAGRFQIE